ncbi:MAG: CinA family protein [Candidatus Bipolaricaulota bacterium]|nr:CinA family protein [Candidatus Bipolaricaulota bacterium]
MLLEEQIGEELRKRKLTIAVAESCTGGLLGSRLTDVAGSSEYFLGGVIAYQNEVKESVLRVPHKVIAAHGAVSSETAEAMASGCRDLFKCDIAVSITGIAGPGGGTAEKPVGLTYIGLATSRGVISRRFRWEGSRMQNKESSVRAAIEMILSALKLEA